MRKQKVKKPQLGDLIVHHEPWFNESNEGRVIKILDSQFLYVLDSGAIRHCMFNELWDFIDK